MNYIKNFDLSGSEIKFKINSQNTYKTKCGGIFTIFLIILFSILFILLGNDFYMRINPKISISVESPENYFNYTLNSKSFLFGFRADDQNGLPVKRPEFFYFEPHYIVYNKTKNGNVKIIDTILKFRECQRSDMNNNSIYDIQGMSNWNCFEWPTGGLITGGLYDNVLIQYIKIKMLNCRKAPKDYLLANNITCSDDITELKRIYSNYIYFSVIIQNYIVDGQNYERPFYLGFNNLYDTLDLKIQKKIYYYLKKGVLKDNKGWLLDAVDESEYYGLDRTKIDFMTGLADELNMNYYECNLYFEHIIEKFDRRYSTIQELLANIGGLIKAFSLLISFVMRFYNDYYRDIYILNQFHQILVGEDSEIKKIPYISNVSRSNVNVNSKFNNEYMLNSEKLPMSFKKNRKVIISMTIYEMIRDKLFYKRNDRFVSYLKGMDMLRDRMNIVNILKSLGRIDTLSEVLNEEQVKKIDDKKIDDKKIDDKKIDDKKIDDKKLDDDKKIAEKKIAEKMIII
jgi:hypothetical protein